MRPPARRRGRVVKVSVRCGFQLGRPIMRRDDRVLVDVSFDGVRGTAWLIPCAEPATCGGYHFGAFRDQDHVESLLSAALLARLRQLLEAELPAALAAIEMATRDMGTEVFIFGIREVN